MSRHRTPGASATPLQQRSKRGARPEWPPRKARRRRRDRLACTMRRSVRPIAAIFSGDLSLGLRGCFRDPPDRPPKGGLGADPPSATQTHNKSKPALSLGCLRRIRGVSDRPFEPPPRPSVSRVCAHRGVGFGAPCQASNKRVARGPCQGCRGVRMSAPETVVLILGFGRSSAYLWR